MSEAETGPEPFAELLGLRGLVLVGGQAVNLWAEVFLPAERRLEAYQPFTSKDADVYVKDVRDVATRAQALGWTWKAYNEARTMALGILTKGAPPLVVEVLRSVRGLKDEELSKATELELESGRYLIPTPVKLLRAKLANVCEITEPGRQDLKHVKILGLVCPAFVHRMFADVLDGIASESHLVGEMNELVTVVTSDYADRCTRALGYSLRTIVPRDLDASTLPKLKVFCASLDKRLKI